MPRQFDLPGGTLITTDPDPTEVALRRAQIAKLLQETASGQAQIPFQQSELQQRGGIAAAQHALGVDQLNLDRQKLAETLPIERGKLTAEQQRVTGEDRYHTGSLNEEIRAHNLAATNEAARVKAGLIGDTMTHVLPSEMAGQVPKGTVESMVTALGEPGLAASMKSVRDRKTIADAIKFADQYKTLDEKKFGAATAGLPPGTDQEFTNAAWNQYKATHPNIYGKDVSAAAETALKPAAAAPAANPLTSAFVAPGAGSPSVGWAMGPDSPLASSTPGVSQFGPKNPQMGLVDPTTNDVMPLPGGTIAKTGTTAPVNDIVKAATAAPVATSTGPVQGPPMDTAAAALPPPINPNVRPPTVDIDQALQAAVGGPTMEELRRRRLSQPAAVLTPFRTNQY